MDRNLIALVAGLALAIGWSMFSTGLAVMLRGSGPLPPRLRSLALRHGWPGEPIPTKPLRRAATLVFGAGAAAVCLVIPGSALLNPTVRLTEGERWLFISVLLFMAAWTAFLLYMYARVRQSKPSEMRVS